MTQKVTRSLMLISGTLAAPLILARRRSRPAAFAEVCNVYCAVLDSDSRMRRAIFSRMPDIRVAGESKALALDVAGATRSLERIMPAGPEPSPASMPSWIRFFAKDDTRGDE